MIEFNLLPQNILFFKFIIILSEIYARDIIEEYNITRRN